MILNVFNKMKGFAPLLALVLLMCSCAMTPPEDADDLVISESFGIEISEDNGPAFDDTVYTPTKGLEYSLSGDKSYYVVSGIGEADGAEIVIPSEHNGKPVKKIGEKAFAGGRFISVVIPDSITHIEDRAFFYCYNLKQVIGGRGVSILGEGVFENCISLTEYTVYKAMIKISSDAFMNCFALSAINVTPANELFASINGDLYSKNGKILLRYALGKPDDFYTVSDTVSEIGAYAFAGAYRLSMVEFGKGVTKIGDGAFYACYGIEELYLPDTVQEIGSSAFANCSSLLSVNTGGAKVISDGAFARCQRLRTAVIGDSAEKLGNYLFYHCRRLKNVTIGENADKIGAYAFGECSSLAQIELGGVKMIDSYAFYNCYDLKSIDIPAGVATIGYQAFFECKELADVTLRSGLVRIGKYAFCKTAISEIALPEGLLTIDDSAFAACANLDEIIIPDSVEIIGAYAFCGCETLESVVIGKGVKYIGSSAFSECVAVEDAAYRGSAEEFKSIVIENYNNAITDLKIKYNYQE
ncbi:MAG: leucine-rich repeat domain-containing protein [Clostridia bacterium]|nr:leucine-rich repeat domain-containing protein [Clostridia bacterium]